MLRKKGDERGLAMFGKYIKEKRIEADLTLREFCRQLGEDASNWSKVEREKLSPPRDEAKLKKISVILGIQENSDDWNLLFDLASVDSGSIPNYIKSEKEVMKVLPLFFRTVGSVKPSSDELKELIQNLKMDN